MSDLKHYCRHHGGPRGPEAAARITELETLLAERDRALGEAREVIAPFATEFEERREAYIRRYPRNPGVGAHNFDAMPDEWPMENSTFPMGTYRRARAFLKETDDAA